MRAASSETLDLTNTGVGIKGATAIFEWLGASTSLTSLTMKAAGAVSQIGSAPCGAWQGAPVEHDAHVPRNLVQCRARRALGKGGRRALAGPGRSDLGPGAAVRGDRGTPAAAQPAHARAATIQAASGTQVRDNGPRPRHGGAGETPASRSLARCRLARCSADAIKGELALKDGRMGCAEGYVLAKLLESGAGASLEILTLVEIYYTTEVRNTLGER